MGLVRWTDKQEDHDLDVRQSPFGRFRAELDKLFERFLEVPKGVAREGISSLTGWGPSVDVSESDKAVTVRAELPGVEPGDIAVTLTGQALTITGEKKESTESKDENWHRSERRFGSFTRSITLPAPVDAEEVSARHDHGVLTIELKKCEGDVPKKIAIGGGRGQ
ncbi:MAG: Hsp20/alpha crystallin family protein [Phycisphaerae bacterium]|jgi:HSP20 family protein